MRAAPDFAALAAGLSTAARVQFATTAAERVGGGCINECFRWQSSEGPCFVKLAEPGRLSMFEAESDGLRELGAAKAVRVPRALASGRTATHAFLVLEWIERGRAHPSSEAVLGKRLAAQHRTTTREFGWHRDNTIGLTPQLNGRSTDWVEFFGERRLRFQLDLAARNGFGRLLAVRGERLLGALPALLDGHEPLPSLLHGDLWGGNWFADAAGEPVIFDPAVYYGDREADLAMTRLFGGFGDTFHAAYEAAWPLDSGHVERRELYNLYHVLNHANLFGGRYASEAAAMIDRLVARAAA